MVKHKMSKLIVGAFALSLSLMAATPMTTMPVQAASTSYSSSQSIHLNEYIKSGNFNYGCEINITDPDITTSNPNNTIVIHQIKALSASTAGVTIPKTLKVKYHDKTYTCRIVEIAERCIKKSDSPYTVSGKLDLSSASWLKTIGAEAFAHGDNSNYLFTTVNLGNVTKISDSAFALDTHITSFTAEKATRIEKYAFYGCKRLRTLKLPACKFVGERACYDCNDLTTVVFGTNTISKIEDRAFFRCLNLKTVKIQNADGTTTTKFPKITTIGTEAFALCNFTKLILNSANVECYAFASNENLTSVSNTNKSCKYDKDAFVATPYGKNK